MDHIAGAHAHGTCPPPPLLTRPRTRGYAVSGEMLRGVLISKSRSASLLAREVRPPHCPRCGSGAAQRQQACVRRRGAGSIALAARNASRSSWPASASSAAPSRCSPSASACLSCPQAKHRIGPHPPAIQATRPGPLETWAAPPQHELDLATGRANVMLDGLLDGCRPALWEHGC